ncbi:hypothetical protein A2U01_0045259, partial [Trifolium medium]|nr:hypothetical protein [Trifolium medium]
MMDSGIKFTIAPKSQKALPISTPPIVHGTVKLPGSLHFRGGEVDIASGLFGSSSTFLSPSFVAFAGFSPSSLLFGLMTSFGFAAPSTFL